MRRSQEAEPSAAFARRFFRVSAPGPSPSWDSSPGAATEAAPFAHSNASAAEQEIWGGIWRWLHGGQPGPQLEPALGSTTAMVETIRSSRREMDRIGAGYALGTDAAHGDAQAVAALCELMHGPPNARRAAMYGLASAGDVAVAALLDLLRAELSSDSGDQDRMVAAMLALGEADRTPLPESVELLGQVLSKW